MTSESKWADALHKVCAERDALKAELKKERAGWQPIETAPKNWPVLVHCPKDGRTCFTDIQLTFGNGDRAIWQKCRPHHQPTHWMPLPKPPEETTP